jgi:hypothetical protein
MRKYILSAAAGLALLAGSLTAAHAGGVSVGVSIGIPFPAPIYVGPAPAYYPAPVYYAPPAPVYYAPRAYYAPPVYYAPRPVFVGRGFYGHGHGGHRGHWR